MSNANTERSAQRGSAVAGNAIIAWIVPPDALTVDVDLGLRFVTLTRDQVLALREALNGALPHMAVQL